MNDLVNNLRAVYDGDEANPLYLEAADELERLYAFVGKVRASEVEFVLFQEDECLATGTGDYESMQAEAAHYAMMYGQDGPVTVEMYLLVPLDALAELDKGPI